MCSKIKKPVMNIPDLLSSNMEIYRYSSQGSGPLASGPTGPGSGFSVILKSSQADADFSSLGVLCTCFRFPTKIHRGSSTLCSIII